MSMFWRPTTAYRCWIPTYQPELYHHGIKGQKWGVRRFQNKDGTRTEAGKKRELNKWNHADNLGANLAVSAATAVGGTAAYVLTGNPYAGLLGAKALQQVPGLAIAYGKGKKEDIRTRKLQVDEKTGLKIKDPSKKWTVEEDLKAVNPEYTKLTQFNTGATHNCMLCSMTYDLRRRGYDVRANRAVTGWQTEDVAHWYPGFKTKNTNLYSKSPQTLEEYRALKKSEPKTKADIDEYVNKAMTSFSKEKVGSRGLVLVTWSGGMGGHAMSYEIHKDGPHLYDPQCNKEYKDPKKILSRTTEFQIGRLDNLKPDPRTIKEVTKQ